MYQISSTTRRYLRITQFAQILLNLSRRHTTRHDGSSCRSVVTAADIRTVVTARQNTVRRYHFIYILITFYYYASAPMAEALSDDARLTTGVCLSVAYIGPKSRTEMPILGRLKLTRTPLLRSKGQRSTCRGRGILWWPPAQLVSDVCAMLILAIFALSVRACIDLSWPRSFPFRRHLRASPGSRIKFIASFWHNDANVTSNEYYFPFH